MASSGAGESRGVLNGSPGLVHTGPGTLEEAMQAAIARLQAIFREELTKEPSDVVFLGAIKVVGPEGLMLRPNGKQPKQTGALPRTTKRSR